MCDCCRLLQAGSQPVNVGPVTSIVVDDTATVWIGSARGLFKTGLVNLPFSVSDAQTVRYLFSHVVYCCCCLQKPGPVTQDSTIPAAVTSLAFSPSTKSLAVGTGLCLSVSDVSDSLMRLLCCRPEAVEAEHGQSRVALGMESVLFSGCVDHLLCRYGSHRQQHHRSGLPT